MARLVIRCTELADAMRGVSVRWWRKTTPWKMSSLGREATSRTWATSSPPEAMTGASAPIARQETSTSLSIGSSYQGLVGPDLLANTRYNRLNFGRRSLDDKS